MDKIISEARIMEVGLKRAFSDPYWSVKGAERIKMCSDYIDQCDKIRECYNQLKSYLVQKKLELLNEPRNIVPEDYDKGHLQLLSSLSEFNTKLIPQIEYSNFVKNNGHTVWVIEKNNIIVASATLVIEQKLIHVMGKVGHIEDVVVHKDYRTLGYGQILVKHLVNEAKRQRCYKVILDCKPELSPFYEKNGFVVKGNAMAIYY